MKKKRIVREKRTVVKERIVRDAPLYNKPRLYKVNDLVVVDFITTKYVCKITNLRFRDDLWPKRWTYYCIVESPLYAKGWKFPNVGINTSEEEMNIVGKFKVSH